MTNDIAEFLNRRLDEEERVAQAALDEVSWYEPVIARPDTGYAKLPTEPERRWALDHEAELGVYVNGTFCAVDDGPAAHIARQDPRATLDRVTALRAVVAMHQPSPYGWVQLGDDARTLLCGSCGSGEEHEYPTFWPCPTLRALASAYRRHPEFEEAWAMEVSGRA